MKKDEILKKLAEKLKDDVNYTFINLDLRKYPHENGLFLAYNMEIE